MDKDSDLEFNFKNKWPELLLFVVALVIINFWINIHLGLAAWVKGLASGVSLILGVIGFLSSFMTEAEKSKYKSFLRKLLMIFVNRRVLIVVYSLILLIVGFLSSVTISAENISEDVPLKIASSQSDLPAAEIHLVEASTKESFVKFIFPWGRSYYAEAPGYLGESFTVYPWNTKVIKLKTESCLLLRFLGHPPVFAGGYIEVYYENESTRIENDGYNSLILGAEKSITSERKNEWREKLIGLGGTEPMVSRFIDEWTDYKRHALAKKLTPGKSIQVKVYNKNGVLKCETGKIAITDEPLQDKLITL